MTKKKKEKTVRINLTVSEAFGDLLTVKAKKDYVPTATWIKQFLMKNIYNPIKNKEVKTMKTDG